MASSTDRQINPKLPSRRFTECPLFRYFAPAQRRTMPLMSSCEPLLVKSEPLLVKNHMAIYPLGAL